MTYLFSPLIQPIRVSKTNVLYLQSLLQVCVEIGRDLLGLHRLVQLACILLGCELEPHGVDLLDHVHVALVAVGAVEVAMAYRKCSSSLKLEWAESSSFQLVHVTLRGLCGF